MINFKSDNESPAIPSIIKALSDNKLVSQAAYGEDNYNATLKELLSKIFETDLEVYTVATGTAANSIALSVMTPPFGSIYCAKEAHIDIHECGAPEFFTGGSKIITLAIKSGKISLEDLTNKIKEMGTYGVHEQRASTLSITQATEYGTIYSINEIKEITELCHKNAINVHMDGARFANALVSLNCKPADITWKAGIDTLVLGATKGGALASECIIFFKPELFSNINYRIKRSGHLWCKNQYLTRQFLAWLDKDLWLKQAKHSNNMANLIFSGLNEIGPINTLVPVETNMLFILLEKKITHFLEKENVLFYYWPYKDNLIRLVCSWSTSKEEVSKLLYLIKESY